MIPKNLLPFTVLLALLSFACSKKETASKPAQKDSVKATQPSQAQVNKLFFEESGKFYSANMDGSNIEMLLKCIDPSASPDGKFVAYTDYGKKGERRIAMYEIATKTKRVFTSIPDSNSYGPVLSPDSKHILFNHFLGSNWAIASLDADDKNFRIITPQSVNDRFSGYYSPSWLLDGWGFICHNLDTAYAFSPTGSLLEKHVMKVLVPIEEYGISSASHLFSDPANHRIFIEAGSDEEDGIEIEHYGIFVYDTQSKRSNQISPDSLHAWDPHWYEAEKKFFFRGYSNADLKAARRKSEWGQADWKMYSVNADGSDLRVIFDSKSIRKTK